MPIKEGNMMKWYGAHLRALCLTWNDAVTAGQVANRIGVSRNTAKKWLEKMVLAQLAHRCIGVHVNKQQKTGYVPYGEW